MGEPSVFSLQGESSFRYRAKCPMTTSITPDFFPILDFNKPSASSNAVVKVGNDGKHKYHVNKENRTSCSARRSKSGRTPAVSRWRWTASRVFPAVTMGLERPGQSVIRVAMSVLMS
uniref:Uncharacterized protein n=1 Tax=Globodera rostochiensis TaxID=31243 RepID=A0A914I4S0_GLORO